MTSPPLSLPFVVSPADAQPTEAEREVWEQVDVVLKDAKGILDELQAYKGAGAEIREVRNLPVQRPSRPSRKQEEEQRGKAADVRTESVLPRCVQASGSLSNATSPHRLLTSTA